MTPFEYIIIPLGWIVGNIVFNGFEKHLPLWRRGVKFVVTVGVLYASGNIFGPYVLYGTIAVMVIGMIVLHGWWFPKHGIHWRTAEPHDRYLALIARMKGRRG